MKSFNAIRLFFFLFIAYAIAADLPRPRPVPPPHPPPKIRIVTSKHPCGCTDRQIAFIKASSGVAKKQIVGLHDTMEKHVTPAETALLGYSHRRFTYIKMLSNVAWELGNVQTANELAHPALGVLSVICNNPGQPPMQGQGTLHQNVLHLGPLFFTLLGMPTRTTSFTLISNRIQTDINNYNKVKRLDLATTVTPFEHDNYAIPWNPASTVIFWVLQVYVVTHMSLQLPSHQTFKGGNPLTFVAFAFVNNCDPDAVKIAPKAKSVKFDLAGERGRDDSDPLDFGFDNTELVTGSERKAEPVVSAQKKAAVTAQRAQALEAQTERKTREKKPYRLSQVQSSPLESVEEQSPT